MPLTRKKSLNADVNSEILRLHSQGSTAQEISDKTNVSHAVVMTVLHEAQAAAASRQDVSDQTELMTTKSKKAAVDLSAVSDEEEQKLVNFLVELDQFNLNWSIMKLRQALRKYATVNHLHESCRTVAWIKDFMERHNDKVTDVPEVIESTTVAEVFFAVVEKVMANLDITNRPECLWNMELVSCCSGGRNRRVSAIKSRRNGKPAVEDPSETVKVLCAVAASGKNSSPAILFSGSKVVNVAWSSELPDEVKSTVSYLVGTEGQTDCDVALRWLQDVFVKDIPESDRPILMLVDGRYGSVDCVPLISWARDQNIHLMCVPSECADIVRPLDLAARWAIRKQWQAVASKGAMRGPAPKPSAIVKAFITAYVNAMNELNVKAVFRCSGFFPLNPQAVSGMLKLADDHHPDPTEYEDPPACVAAEQLGQDYQDAVRAVIDALIKDGLDAKRINKMLKNAGIAARLKVSTE